MPLLPRPHRRLTFLSQIWSGLLPMLYSTERNPLWNVFLNMPGPRRAGPGAPLPPPGAGAAALRKDTAAPADPSAPPPHASGSRRQRRRHQGTTFRARRLPSDLLPAAAEGAGCYGSARCRGNGVGRGRARGEAEAAVAEGPGGALSPSLRHSGAAPWGGRRRPRAGTGWSVPACRALRPAAGVERWRTRPCRGLGPHAVVRPPRLCPLDPASVLVAAGAGR